MLSSVLSCVFLLCVSLFLDCLLPFLGDQHKGCGALCPVQVCKCLGLAVWFGLNFTQKTSPRDFPCPYQCIGLISPPCRETFSSSFLHLCSFIVCLLFYFVLFPSPPFVSLCIPPLFASYIHLPAACFYFILTISSLHFKPFFLPSFLMFCFPGTRKQVVVSCPT